MGNVPINLNLRNASIGAFLIILLGGGSGFGTYKLSNSNNVIHTPHNQIERELETISREEMKNTMILESINEKISTNIDELTKIGDDLLIIHERISSLETANEKISTNIGELRRINDDLLTIHERISRLEASVDFIKND